MVRRSFRTGLWLGLLAGILLAVVKMAQSRREDQEWDAGSAEWPPVETAAPETTPPLDYLPPPGPPAAEVAPLADGGLPLPPSDDELVEAFLESPEPRAEVAEPVADVPEPVADVPEPVVDVPEPVVDVPEPVVDVPEPVVDVPEPVVDVPEPVAEPVVEVIQTVEPPPPAPAAKKAVATKKVRKATVNKAAAEKAAGKTAKKAVGKASPRKATAKKAVKATAKKAGKTSKKAIKAVAPPALRWVEAVDGACPPSHPVKAKLASRLFHLPGMAFYARTRADRCYADEESAVGDGLTRSKR